MRQARWTPCALESKKWKGRDKQEQRCLVFEQSTNSYVCFFTGISPAAGVFKQQIVEITSWTAVQVFEYVGLHHLGSKQGGLFHPFCRFQGILISIKQVRKRKDYSFPGTESTQFGWKIKGQILPITLICTWSNSAEFSFLNGNSTRNLRPKKLCNYYLMDSWLSGNWISSNGNT